MKSYKIKLLETDFEFVNLLPLVIRFSQETRSPLWQNLGDICRCFIDQESLTMIQLEKEKGITGYICGYPMNKVDFLTTQAFNLSPKLGKPAVAFFEKEVRETGRKNIIMVSMLPSKIWERHGYVLHRNMYIKNLTNGC